MLPAASVAMTMFRTLAPVIGAYLATKVLGGSLSTLGGKTLANAVGTKGLPKILNTVSGGVLSGLGSLANGAVGTVKTAIPIALQGAGRLTSAAGTTAGAGVQALANIPGHLAGIGTSDRKDELYGKGILSALGGISSDVGNAAGVGLSALGTAAGSTIEGLGSYLLQQRIYERMLGHQAKQFGAFGSATPAQARAFGAAQSALGTAGRASAAP